MFVADKANAEQTGTITAAAAEGLVRVWWRDVVVLLSTAFVLEGSFEIIFKEEDNMVTEKMSIVTVLI